jgi:hypothetical protein
MSNPLDDDAASTSAKPAAFDRPPISFPIAGLIRLTSPSGEQQMHSNPCIVGVFPTIPPDFAAPARGPRPLPLAAEPEPPSPSLSSTSSAGMIVHVVGNPNAPLPPPLIPVNRIRRSGGATVSAARPSSPPPRVLTTAPPADTAAPTSFPRAATASPTLSAGAAVPPPSGIALPSRASLFGSVVAAAAVS